MNLYLRDDKNLIMNLGCNLVGFDYILSINGTLVGNYMVPLFFADEF